MLGDDIDPNSGLHFMQETQLFLQEGFTLCRACAELLALNRSRENASVEDGAMPKID